MSFDPPLTDVGAGLLVLHIQGPASASGLEVPEATIDGNMVLTRFGPTEYFVSPGRHDVEVRLRNSNKGRASLAVDVPAGGVVEVFYAAPWFGIGNANIGLRKQRREGKRYVVSLTAVLLTVIVGYVILRL